MIDGIRQPEFVRRRLDMIERQCRERGIHDERVLAAMSAVPRETFVPDDVIEDAYADRAMSIGSGQTISQPYIVALMSASLASGPTDKVLEIGTGSGYQTAILAMLSGEVHTIERIAELAQAARDRLRALGLANVHFHVGDGSTGWPPEGPYDRIIVTAGAPRIEPALLEQLADGGRLVLPVGDEESQVLTVVERRGPTFSEHRLLGCRFVKLIGRAGWPAP